MASPLSGRFVAIFSVTALKSAVFLSLYLHDRCKTKRWQQGAVSARLSHAMAFAGRPAAVSGGSRYLRTDGHVGSLPFGDALDCARHPHLNTDERIANSFGDSFSWHFSAPQKHFGLSIVSRYDERLRYQYGRAAVEDDRLEQHGRVVYVEYDAGRHARSEFLPDSRANVQFSGRAQPLTRESDSHHALCDVIRLVNRERQEWLCFGHILFRPQHHRCNPGTNDQPAKRPLYERRGGSKPARVIASWALLDTAVRFQAACRLS